MEHSDILQVIQIFNSNRITYWLTGGRAIDLFLGFASRPHKDIDFFVLDSCFPSSLKLLVSAGYSILPQSKGIEGAALQKDSSLIDITRIYISLEGSISTFGIYETIVWPESFLAPFIIDIGYVKCSTLSLSNHMVMKRAVADWYMDGQLRPEDMQDIQNLREMGLIR